MSNLIEFLEKLGQNSQLRNVTGLELQAALSQAGIESSVHAALAGADRHSLETQAGAATNVCCLIHAAEDDSEGDASVPAPSVRHAA
ncbi:hypothetical protein [Steroidobacter cummioxidans]|uniref:hypothetical protein n=1 Tax=Steroidobacter cummioxidans TaxID=1803913 RepID=UPI000E3212B4|nr:hypothetical protein [Steroidobacter cummioxidans]